MSAFDDIVVGTGMAGLTAGALLARAGRRVLLLEAHDTPGGYCHTFEMGAFRFCAQVHYIFSCGEGEPVDRLLRHLGLEDEVRFVRLDPEGFDHVVVAGDRYRIPNGFGKWRDRLIRRHPEAERPLRRYFSILEAVRDELGRVPSSPGWRDLVTAVFRLPHLLRDRRSTLADVFDRVGMPPRLRAVLAGQAGDYLLPPGEASFLVHTAVVSAYDRGAYYPERHFAHLVDAIVAAIRAQPGCALETEREVTEILVQDGRARGVRTAQGEVFESERVISNADPLATLSLLPPDARPSSRSGFDYPYSTSAFTMYLGLKDIDLRDHGFGSFNVWHYPHDDLDAIYRRQLEDHDLSDPWLFLSTPTLHTDAPGLAPPGHQILEVATCSSYAHFAELKAKSSSDYNREKVRVREAILDRLDASYVPGIRDHLALRVVGTPTTNERYVRAPQGNAYGAALGPDGIRWPRVPHETSVEGLYLLNATAGYPSIGGTVASGLALHAQLTGERV